MAGLLTHSERAVKRQQVSDRNTAAMARITRLVAARGPLSAAAQQHWQLAQQTGFPQFRQEEWHYTPLDEVLAAELTAQTGALAELPPAVMTSLAAHRVILIDGVYAPQWSDSDTGVFELTMADGEAPFPAAVSGEIFLHLTEALAENPLHINVRNGAQAEKPLYIVNIATGSGNALPMHHSRYHLTIGTGASVRVIEHFISTGDNAHFSGARLTADIGENSDVHHLKLGFENSQAYHFAHNDFVIAAHARVESTGFLLGGALTRHHTSTQLNGEGISLAMNSLVMPKQGEIADTRTYLEHNKGYCESRQCHKTIVMDDSRAVFNGMIKVAPHALKTDGQMTNNNLLLGRNAQADTKPQLEIYADDVKCSHGATVGRIDEEQLLYLRTRGIREQAARQMIILAFAAELTESIDDEQLKNVVMDRIRLHLAQSDKEPV